MRQRRYDYDILRVFSMVGVIYLHSAVGALRALYDPVLWNFSNMLACLFTPAVPLFFMMSGALLLDSEKTGDLDNLFRHRLPKIVIPTLAWSAVMLLYKVYMGDAAGALTTISHLLNTGVAVPYWFMYALVPMYLLSPMLKRMIDNISEQHWHYMMALWVFLTLGLNTIRFLTPPSWELTFTEHWTLNINMVGGYLGYFMLGYYLEHMVKLHSKKVLSAVLVLMLAVAVIGTRWDSYHKGYYSDHFTNYLTLFTMVLASAIFLLAKVLFRERKIRSRLVPCLSGLSFGIYLVHPLAIGLFEKLWGRIFPTTGPVTIPQQLIFCAAVALFCFAVCLVLASVKPLCFLFTGQTWRTACRSSNLRALFPGKTVENLDRE